MLHDKVRPHSAADTVEANRQLKFEILPPSPIQYGPSSSAFHIWTTKEVSRARRFPSDDKVKYVKDQKTCEPSYNIRCKKKKKRLF